MKRLPSFRKPRWKSKHPQQGQESLVNLRCLPLAIFSRKAQKQTGLPLPSFCNPDPYHRIHLKPDIKELNYNLFKILCRLFPLRLDSVYRQHDLSYSQANMVLVVATLFHFPPVFVNMIAIDAQFSLDVASKLSWLYYIYIFYYWIFNFCQNDLYELLLIMIRCVW